MSFLLWFFPPEFSPLHQGNTCKAGNIVSFRKIYTSKNSTNLADIFIQKHVFGLSELRFNRQTLHLLCLLHRNDLTRKAFFPDFLKCSSSDDDPVIVYVSKMSPVEKDLFPENQHGYVFCLTYTPCLIK